MLQLLQFLLPSHILRPVLKPLTRFFLGFIAIPIFRIVMRKVVRVQEIDEELEKDLEQWFRGSLLLLAATHNMEGALFGENAIDSPYFLAGRLLLAIGVIEGMPDQSLFALIHPGPQKPQIEKGHLMRSLWRYAPQFLKGIICQHLNRSSPVLAILSVLPLGTSREIGWICYGLAIAQYLLIGLVTSKDKALNVLKQFDEAVSRQRQDIETALQLSQAARLSAQTKHDTMPADLESM